MAAMMKLMIVWLCANFDLQSTERLPRVELLPAHQLALLHYGSAGSSGDDVVSLYDDISQTIYLKNDWSGKTPAETSALLHELVHHLQNLASTRYSCPEEREALAYRAQKSWLALFGETLEEDFGIDEFTLKVKTLCLPY